MESKPTHSSFWANLFKVQAQKNELEHILSIIPPFQEFSKKDYKLLINLIHNRTYVAGEYIFYQGDPGIGLYIILDGQVVIERVSETGHKLILANFKPGDFFGELALIDGAKRSASAIANTDSKLAVIFKPDLDEFIEKNPAKGVLIMRGLSQIIVTRLRSLNQEFLEFQEKTNK